MKIEKLMGFKHLLKNNGNDQYVVINSKRNFANKGSIYVRPRYIKKSVVELGMNNDRAVKNLKNNFDFLRCRSSENENFNGDVLEERIVVSLVMDRNKFDMISEKSDDYYDEEILYEGVLDEEIHNSLLPNIVEVSPAKMSYYDEENFDSSFKNSFAIVQKSSFVEFDKFIRDVKSLGYDVNISKHISKSLCDESSFDDNNYCYEDLCSIMMDSVVPISEMTNINYCFELVIRDSLNKRKAYSTAKKLVR